MEYNLYFITYLFILHLLGYDHETAEAEQEMIEKQRLVFKKFMLE